MKRQVCNDRQIAVAELVALLCRYTSRGVTFDVYAGPPRGNQCNPASPVNFPRYGRPVWIESREIESRHQLRYSYSAVRTYSYRVGPTVYVIRSMNFVVDAPTLRVFSL
eukprot:scaffold56491_cov75-Phaeocystis_antarctica.AAC.1